MVSNFFKAKDVENFFEQYFNKHILRGSYLFDDLVSDELWETIQRGAISWPQLSLLYDGKQISPIEYTHVDPEGDREININQLNHLYSAGRTIRVKKIYKYHSKLMKLKNDLEKSLNTNCGINLYCSLANSIGLKEHKDIHQIFALQIKGSKKWEMRWTSESSYQEEILYHQDVMYVPKGMYHKTKTLEESMHLAISFNIPTVKDILNQHIDSYNFFNENIPFRFNSNGDICYEIEKITEAFSFLMEKNINDNK